MKRRKWAIDEKLAIVLEGIKERRSVAEICREHQISQTLDYRWRDRFLESGKKGLMNSSGDDNVYKTEIERLQRTPIRKKPEADNKPKRYLGYRYKQVFVSSLGWVSLVIVLDWWTKKLVGWNISLRSKTADWKQALGIALNKEFPEGVRGKGLKLISDNGCQPTPVSFMRDMATLGIEQIFTSYDNPKGNADTERMIRTIKEEVIWLNDFETLEETQAKIGKWIANDYNRLYLHSGLGLRNSRLFTAVMN